MKKVYDKDGKECLLFAVGDEKKVEEFTKLPAKTFKVVKDRIFGKAYEIPCRLERK